MEIAGTSDAVWLLTLDISERPSEKIINHETLALYGWAMHEVVLPRALHDGSLVYIYIYIYSSIYNMLRGIPVIRVSSPSRE